MMDVRILICLHPGNVFHVSVALVDCDRGWHKLYRSKAECVEELARAGLLTILDQDAVMRSDFHSKERILVFQANIEMETLSEAHFVETTPVWIN